MLEISLSNRVLLLSSQVVVIAAAMLGPTGCASKASDDPIGTLSSPSLTGLDHIKALEALSESSADDAETNAILKRVLTRPGYTVPVREAALNQLAERDLGGLKIEIRRTLPLLSVGAWHTRLCEIVAERNWADLSPALVSSWARPAPILGSELDRPEYKALAALHGVDHVTDVVFQIFVESTAVSQQGLRTRCWNLLHRLGQRERLIAMVAGADVASDDAMLIDLQAGARELGLIPHNREEILWLRKLREPERAEFWTQAVRAVSGLSPQRKTELEIRDVPVVVSASLHDPELLALSTAELYKNVEQYLKTQRHHVQESNYDNFAGGSQQRLYEYKDRLTWGDLAAMTIAIRAMQIPQVAAHMFSYAERDKADQSTEYGGVISLDARDRFEIREFVPAYRQHDQVFHASQAMLDAAYTSIFHFHLHAQQYRNDKYAGPGYGDINYADNTRANCLVFTFMNKDTLNMDFYRHDRVVVDLGEVKRPQNKTVGVQPAMTSPTMMAIGHR